jgi:hypothetical protein
MSVSLGVKSTAAPSPILTKKRGVRVHVWILLVVCGLYVVQLWTPLRLDGDSIELLSIASSAADGHGFLDHGQKTRYGVGYPAMVVCLERAGAARPWGLVGLNALFLLIGFTCAKAVARQYFELSNDWAVTTVLFTALSFVLVKHFTLPLTDIPFFGVSLVAVVLLVRAGKESGAPYLFWVAALATSVLGVAVRPIGIALFPSLAWSLGARLGVGNILRQNKRMTLISLGSAAVLCSAMSVLLLRTKYVQEDLSAVASQGLGHTAHNILLYRVHEFGELFLNAPASKLGKLSPLVWLAGAVASVALVVSFRRCRLGIVEVYLAAYTAIMFLWHAGDTRFWIPVLPLIFAELFSLLRPWTFTGWKKRASMLYAAAYMLAGFAALAYSTRITFSGPDFPYRFGDGTLRSTYELFYSDPGVDRSNIDGPALEILQRYSGGKTP